MNKIKCRHLRHYLEEYPTYTKYICSKCGSTIGVETKRQEPEND